MNSEWQLHEAKVNFSQLIRRAAVGDAQVVTLGRCKPGRATREVRAALIHGPYDQSVVSG